MKLHATVALIAALVLAGCASQPDAAKQAAPGQTVADASPAAKKKCAEASTGSRLRSCNGMTADSVEGTSGDDYRDTMTRMMTQGSKNN